MSPKHYLLAFAALLLSCQASKEVARTGPPPAPVAVARAVSESVPVELHLVGSVKASSTVEVKSQVAGPLLKAHFTEGQDVAKDTLLFNIDERPFRESLRQAEAAASKDNALLRQAEANLARDTAQLRNAEAEAARHAELAKAGVISKSLNDQVLTTADVHRQSVRASAAAIETIRASLDSDRAAIDKARLDLSYCAIRAPIAGRTGSLLVHPGNLVKANDVPLVVIHQVTPVHVVFSVPDLHIRAIRARPTLPVRVIRKDDPSRSATGPVVLIDNAVDTTAGTIRLEARLDNRDRLFWPGEFVDVVLTLDTLSNATVVPSEAVQPGQQGPFVYVVGAGDVVQPRPVTTGVSIGARTVIDKGISPGETVVTDGHLRLFPGAKVVPTAAPGKS